MGFDAEFDGFRGGGLERDRRRGDEMNLTQPYPYPSPRGGRLLDEPSHRCAYGKAVPLDDLERLAGRRSIRHRGSARNHGRIVTGHVRNDEGHDPSGSGGGEETTALDGRERLADRVDLPDARAAKEQLANDRRLLLQRDPWRGQGQERRAAARHQRDDEIVLGQALDEGENPSGGLQTGFVRHGMGRLEHLNPACGHRMPVARHHETLQRPVPRRLEGTGHARRRLARVDDDRPPARRRQPGEPLWTRERRLDRRVEELTKQGAGLHA